MSDLLPATPRDLGAIHASMAPMAAIALRSVPGVEGGCYPGNMNTRSKLLGSLLVLVSWTLAACAGEDTAPSGDDLATSQAAITKISPAKTAPTSKGYGPATGNPATTTGGNYGPAAGNTGPINGGSYGPAAGGSDPTTGGSYGPAAGNTGSINGGSYGPAAGDTEPTNGGSYGPATGDAPPTFTPPSKGEGVPEDEEQAEDEAKKG